MEIAAVVGDDLMERLGEMVASGVALDHMDDGTAFAAIRDRVSSANAYYGAWPVVEALRAGAQIVVTGRCTDTGITLAPMIHAFGWAPDDWDRLAAGIVAGHVVECGAQSTGGNFTDWRRIRRFDSIGYPLLEVSPDGSFVLTKHAGTGGAVTVRTVKEQLVYEMGDPRSYITPDVVADFASARLEQIGRDRVRVWGVRGRPAPPALKVSASYFDGWKASGTLIISAPAAAEKAQAFADLFWKRLGLEFEARHVELIGHSACWGPLAPPVDPPEVLLRLSVRDRDRAKIEAFSRLVPAVILSGPPGVAVTGGRPQAQEVVAYWPALIPRDRARPSLVTRDGERTLDWPTPLLAPVKPAVLPRPTWPKAKGSARTVRGAARDAGPRPQRRQGRHLQHRRRRARAGDLPVAAQDADRRAGEAPLPRHLPRQRRAPRGAESMGAQLPAPRIARRRRHRVAAARRPGQDAGARPARDGGACAAGADRRRGPRRRARRRADRPRPWPWDGARRWPCAAAGAARRAEGDAPLEA